MSDRDKIADLLYQAIFKGKIECYRDCEKLSDQILGLLDKPSGLETVKTVMWNTKYPGAHVDEVADVPHSALPAIAVKCVEALEKLQMFSDIPMGVGNKPFYKIINDALTFEGGRLKVKG